jgi:hypothetical protein
MRRDFTLFPQASQDELLVRVHLSDCLIDLSDQSLKSVAKTIQSNGQGASAAVAIMNRLSVLVSIIVRVPGQDVE